MRERMVQGTPIGEESLDEVEAVFDYLVLLATEGYSNWKDS